MKENASEKERQKRQLRSGDFWDKMKFLKQSPQNQKTLIRMEALL
jgi:hypothetical protein